jgi:hypothetical protein
VPPFFVEGFTIVLTPALKAAVPPDAELPLLEPPDELLPPLEHAARVSPAAATAHAAYASLLRLLICGTSPFTE